MTYIIHSDPPSITCGDCGRRSYNHEDIKNRFCGHCHKFHERPSAMRQDAVLPDNPAYVKSSHNMNVTDKQRIEALASSDSTIAACLETYRRGGLTYEMMLEGLVVLLYQQKQAAIAYAVDASARSPMQLVLYKDEVPPDLAPPGGQPDKPL